MGFWGGGLTLRLGSSFILFLGTIRSAVVSRVPEMVPSHQVTIEILTHMATHNSAGWQILKIKMTLTEMYLKRI